MSNKYELEQHGQSDLLQMATLTVRDKELEHFWAVFGDIPMDEETECIETEFLGFPAGTHREDLWRWFDARHSRGVHYLLYRDTDGPSSFSWKDLLNRDALCFDCESHDCAFNNGSLCCFAFVHGRGPTITDEDGCTDGVINTL